ncbi:DUF1622 domain-containing protein [Pontiella agarivorans]|uniref:DUF1622 domain-containing protein n=1 Tax=Pontiella agarivorans TaxID=3038953 RepID=A0ABU5MVP6_9BACT|nr:DUF1622 domain-containing protein [Pontiella agarivorans]MDZ8118245.1 DUF1622 domain-containing protein [Pontiella agarivorans]
MHNFVNILAQYAAYFLEIVSIVIILIGSLRALVPYIGRCLFSKECLREFSATRLRLGHSLSLGLEFLIGADILKSAVSPSWQNLGLLAAIVTIRSVINFLLIWELKKVDGDKTEL